MKFVSSATQINWMIEWKRLDRYKIIRIFVTLLQQN